MNATALPSLCLRQGEHESTPHAHLALDRKLTAHSASQVAADGEAEARAFVRSRQVGPDLREWFENSAVLIERDTDARVADRHAYSVTVTLTPESDGPLGTGELDGIGEQVHEHLTETLWIGAHQQGGGTTFHVERQSLGPCLGGNQYFRAGEGLAYRAANALAPPIRRSSTKPCPSTGRPRSVFGPRVTSHRPRSAGCSGIERVPGDCHRQIASAPSEGAAPTE